MARFLVAIHHRDDFDASKQDAATDHDIDELNDEMKRAGATVFVGGLRPPRETKSVRAEADGRLLVSDGPYVETREHIGGFWVLEVADMEAALAWGRKATLACRANVEVRPFY